MCEPCLSVETFCAPVAGADVPLRLLEGQQVVAVHGFASTPEVTWERTGWVRQLQRAGADIHLVTLPYHRLEEAGLEGSGKSSGQIAVTWQQEGLMASLGTALVQALAGLDTPVHLLGYSLGARICWQVALSSPHLVQSLTLGGLPLATHLDEVQSYLSAPSPAPGAYLPEGLQAVLDASPLPRAALAAFTTQPVEPFTPYKLPACPTLLFAGSDDTLATGLPALAAALPHPASAYLELAGRNHISALTSGQARRASADFMARHAVSRAGSEPDHTVA
ncbi:alpha/beta fold hydrolase [Rothia nasimurium]|uniref:alpha/beta fold hydrolase n=1 Tax=Rothia nasimurium TaxID=85336 RepID=UPI002DD69CA6|nr:alpha/beta fold hydrolase [Rothia nasimurium]